MSVKEDESSMKMVALHDDNDALYECQNIWIRIRAKVKSAMDRRKEIEMIKSPPYLFMLSSVITEFSIYCISIRNFSFQLAHAVVCVIGAIFFDLT